MAIRALDYPQPENTIPMQVALYENIRLIHGYEYNRLDIDLTPTYFEGEECVLAEYWHARCYSSDKLQIVIAFVLDQNGEIESRTERDEKIGYRKRKYGVAGSLVTKGNRIGFSFSFEWTKALTEADKYDGYYI